MWCKKGGNGFSLPPEDGSPCPLFLLEKQVPQDLPWYRHTLEGADEPASHIRAMLTDGSLTIPVDDGRLSLGTWQGIYLFEHRPRPHQRQVHLRCLELSI
ncbi:MAG: YjbQ family protein [Anaerolineales bacterium]|nr:YjbQ family protein [Anaerolineales bacterium]